MSAPDEYMSAVDKSIRAYAVSSRPADAHALLRSARAWKWDIRLLTGPPECMRRPWANSHKLCCYVHALKDDHEHEHCIHEPNKYQDEADHGQNSQNMKAAFSRTRAPTVGTPHITTRAPTVGTPATICTRAAVAIIIHASGVIAVIAVTANIVATAAATASASHHSPLGLENAATKSGSDRQARCTQQ